MKTAAQIQQDRDQDKGTCLSHFPAEIWQLILDKINDADTLLNLATASTFITDMLHPRRNVYLFAPVLKILDQQKYFHFRNFNEPPHLLACRLVSSNWKKAVDNLLQLRPYHLDKILPSYCSRCTACYMQHYNGTHDPVHQALFSLYKFRISEIESDLLPSLDSLHYQTISPFPSRHVDLFDTIILLAEDETFQRYRNATQAFLEKVGHHIWHVRIETSELRSKITLVEWYTLIEKYVQLMPNLRSLCIRTTWSKLDLEELTKLEKLVDKLAFPVLPHLLLLSVHESPKPVMEAIIAANNHLKRVNFSTHQHSVLPVDRKKCALNGLVNPELVSISMSSLKELQDLPDNWRLTLIRLCFRHADFFEWSHVFKKLQSYQETLTEVYLNDLPRGRSQEQEQSIWEQSKVMLELPNVKKFHFSVYAFCSLDFLLGLKSLEWLTLRVCPNASDHPAWFEPTSEVINFNGQDTTEFSSCNIWDLIPSLQKVSVVTYYKGIKEYRRNGKGQIACKFVC